jgi:hypothetical protein
VHSKATLDLNNIETLYTALELGKVIRKFPGAKNIEQIVLTIESLKALIVKTLEARIEFGLSSSRKIIPTGAYQALINLLKRISANSQLRREVSMITFNYDIALDIALHQAGLGPDYVLDRPPMAEQPVQLMKLHGSLNWAKCAGEDKIRPAHLIEYLSGNDSAIKLRHNDTCTIPIGSTLQSFFRERHQTEVDPQPVIVPPTWNKASDHEALSIVWAEAARCLGEADYIFVIGYSLTETDSFFRNLFALGCESRVILRKFIVYDRDQSGAVDCRFKSMLGQGAQSRYRYEPRNFEGVFSDIANILNLP